MRIKIKKGRMPVLLSAPHIYPHINPYSLSLKKAEYRTKELALEIAKRTGAWATLPASPQIKNWLKARAKYKKTILKLIKDQNISLALDLHGCKSSHEFFLDYDFKPTRNAAHPQDKVFEILLLKHLETLPGNWPISNGFFRSIGRSGKNTLTYHIRRSAKIPAVQLEINRKVRNNDFLLYQTIKALSKTINEFLNENTSSWIPEARQTTRELRS